MSLDWISNHIQIVNISQPPRPLGAGELKVQLPVFRKQFDPDKTLANLDALKSIQEKDPNVLSAVMNCRGEILVLKIVMPRPSWFCTCGNYPTGGGSFNEQTQNCFREAARRLFQEELEAQS